ncbi:peptide chain release factor 1-like, mitochondrial isoform X2 [Macrosteles quadrilineatus]|uniref:peptide chain release factor 1-like, mitochondrial isoform X2 n=1 Tax=Macrosteles quadrilineatus TaxID=74068 RepID=UPI0023E30CDC|nr:peptide chain release factor 1-like, mitochondrial isoform X2 [Macrosteles quadrilineatus]
MSTRQLIMSQEATKDNNREMMELIEGDLVQYHTELTEIYEKIIDIILPRGDFDDCNEILLEISAGVGGSEAQLFAGDLFNMYVSFLQRKSWEFHVAEKDQSDLGGVRHCSLLVSGPGAYNTLQLEAGVHRVQRVPETEKGGRMHTSTVTVAVLPQPADVDIQLKDGDLKIETKRASGAGGQHVNTTDSAVRVTHLPTGISVECQSDRLQFKNKETAIKKLKAKLYEREIYKVDSMQRNQRKSQVGTSGRSEKIRTYNFRDDRISDHRLSINLHNMKDFLQGGEQFERLLEQLIRWHHESQIKLFVDSLPS